MFDPYLFLSAEDLRLASSVICPWGWMGRRWAGHEVPWRNPDLTIAPDGEPYLYRWYVIPHDERVGNVYFHIQIGSDPERPLHDHPWDNTSVILAGGYDELYAALGLPTEIAYPSMRQLRKGDVVHRRAEVAHRLILPKPFTYTMTLFTTGPARRRWGFWFPDGWRDERDVITTVDGVSTFKQPEPRGDTWRLATRRDYDGN